MNDLQWDRKLNISTTGRDASIADAYHHPYEPTPYSVLERLAENGYIDGKSKVVDYGCGKGRVGFFLHHKLGCTTIGIEYDEKIYEQALMNQERYAKTDDITFLCRNAQEYEIDDEDCFYFFNPFSVKILKSVMAQIMSSYYKHPRRIRLFFYYPDDEYVAFLMEQNELIFVDEISCQDLFKRKDSRERIVIFEADFQI